MDVSKLVSKYNKRFSESESPLKLNFNDKHGQKKKKRKSVGKGTRFSKKEKFEQERKIEKIVCGDYHTLCLERDNHNVWIFGSQGDSVKIAQPLLVNQIIYNIPNINVGGRHNRKSYSINITDSNDELRIEDIEANKNWSVLMDNMLNIYISKDIKLSKNKKKGRITSMIVSSKIEISRYIKIPCPFPSRRDCNFEKTHRKIEILCHNQGFIICMSEIDPLWNVRVFSMQNSLNVAVDYVNITMFLCASFIAGFD